MKKEYITIKIEKCIYDQLTEKNTLKGMQIKTISNLIKELIEKNKRCINEQITMNNQKCNVCGSENFNFRVVIDKQTLKPKKNECTLACAQCGTPANIIGGKLIQ